MYLYLRIQACSNQYFHHCVARGSPVIWPEAKTPMEQSLLMDFQPLDGHTQESDQSQFT